MDKKIIVSSLALDLRRVAQGLHRGSLASARVFKDEALKRGKELENMKSEGYLKNLWSKTKLCLENNSDKMAEDILMYSTLFQNIATKNFKGS